MKSIKPLYGVLGGMTLLLASSLSFASTTQMNATLARISTILSQVNPLISLAQQQQDPNARVKFQFDELRSDIADIQAGIAQAVNRVSIQPRVVQPLTGDYLPVSETVLKEEQPLKSEDATS